LIGFNIGNLGLKRSELKELKVPIFSPDANPEEKGGEITIKFTAVDFDTDGDGLAVFSISSQPPVKSRGLRNSKSLMSSKLTPKMENIWDSQLGVEYPLDVLAKAKTGDIILHSGAGHFARAIQFSSKSIWSHAAMIIRDPSPAVREKYNLSDHHHVFVLESETTGNTFDKRKGGGVQLSDYEKWIKWYSEMKIHLTVIRHINDSAISINKTQEEMYPHLTEWILSIHNLGYETSKKELVKSVLAGNSQSNHDSFFLFGSGGSNTEKDGYSPFQLNIEQFCPRGSLVGENQSPNEFTP
jgi:hypothetical protein